MTLEELRNKAHSTITAPVSGMEFKIRRVCVMELQEARVRAILGNEQADSVKVDGSNGNSSGVLEQSLRAIAIANQVEISAVRYILGTVSPKIVFNEEQGLQVAADCVDASWLDKADKDFIFFEVMKLSRMTEADNKQVENFSKNAHSPTLQTELADDMGGSLTKSLN